MNHTSLHCMSREKEREREGKKIAKKGNLPDTVQNHNFLRINGK